MINYVEIRDRTRAAVGIIDNAKSIIWKSIYYGVGEFEIYVAATAKTIELLKEDYYVTRPDNSEIGIIEHVNVTYSAQNGRMIVASGRLAKSILDRRHIYKLNGNSNSATILYGEVETEVREVVTNNAIACPFDSNRNIAELELGTLKGYTERIVDSNGNSARKQTTYENLLTYTDELLQEYALGSKVVINKETKKLQYEVIKGIDRTVGNSTGNAPLIFSEDYDNLSNTNYDYDKTALKNTALIGGEGEGTSRFYSLIVPNETGIDRRETFIDASSISKRYTENEVEQTYSDTDYNEMLNTKGKQELAALSIIETFDGTIELINSGLEYGVDFGLGDLVTIQDNKINKYLNVRILAVSEVQDDNGYMVELEYGS